MKKHGGAFRPGSRRQRWQRSHAASGTFFTGLGIVFLLTGAWFLAAPAFLLAYWDAQAYRRGWRLSYELPPHGKIQISRPGLSGDVARAAWARTQEAAKDPNRQRYAFERGRR